MNYFANYTSGGRTVFDPRAMSPSSPPTTAATPGLPDLNRFIAEGLLQPLIDGLNTAVQNFTDTLTPGVQSMTQTASSKSQTGSSPQYQKHHHHEQHHHEHHGHGCGCHHEDCGCRHEDCGCHKEDCGCRKDPCHCNCCIVNADLIVYARLGELRVIPLVIENTWRRERKIKMELSGWTTRGGNPAPVVAKLLPPAPEFELEPCGHKTLTMVVEIGKPGEGERQPDVDDCLVAYADLCVQGCDIRPLRIAVAILPRDCEAYEIECGCSCCC